ncbi:MAG: hypothetical protein K2N86_01510 [Rikenellaceae bacterium]|nr:hypothetical protein [Rikenellaceae bacterium]MDE7355242.1 hypothetical protein [Rikenellaceae bacterium]
MLYAILLIVLGILAVPSLIVSKKPNAKELIDKIAPFQGWLGLVFCVIGIWGIISSIIHIGWLTSYPIIWILDLAVAIVEACLGFILGYNLIVKYVLSKNEAAAAKGEQILAKLLPLQGKLGIAAIVLGIVYIILYFVLFAALLAA